MDLELVDATQKVASGAQVPDPRLGMIPGKAAPKSPALTTRELEVLQLIVHGKSNREIAAVLGLSVNTIAVHRPNVMHALGIHNTAEFVFDPPHHGSPTIT